MNAGLSNLVSTYDSEFNRIHCWDFLCFVKIKRAEEQHEGLEVWTHTLKACIKYEAYIYFNCTWAISHFQLSVLSYK